MVMDAVYETNPSNCRERKSSGGVLKGGGVLRKNELHTREGEFNKGTGPIPESKGVTPNTAGRWV